VKPLQQKYRSELKAGYIAFQQCTSCCLKQHIARPFCAACGAHKLVWLRAGGTGIVVAATVLHRAPSEDWKVHLPYAIALVDLDEGLRMMAHSDPSVVIGQRVRGQVREIGERLLPYFS